MSRYAYGFVTASVSAVVETVVQAVEAVTESPKVALLAAIGTFAPTVGVLGALKLFGII